MKSRVLTDSFQCWPEVAFFKMIIMVRMTRLDISLSEWKLIRKFQKWLYNLHMNPIATRRNSNTTSQCNRSCIKKLCQPNTR